MSDSDGLSGHSCQFCREPEPPMKTTLYNVEWQRSSEATRQVCHNLDPRTMVARIISALENNDSIILHRVWRSK